MQKKIIESFINQNGFGLLEVLICMVICAILGGVLMSVFSHGIAVSGASRKKLNAMYLATGNLDRAVQLLSTDFDSLKAGRITLNQGFKNYFCRPGT